MLFLALASFDYFFASTVDAFYDIRFCSYMRIGLPGLCLRLGYDKLWLR